MRARRFRARAAAIRLSCLAVGRAIVRIGAAVLLWVGAGAVPAAGQLLEQSPNLTGAWVPGAGVVQFHVLHRFEVLDPPVRKVVNSPTLLLAAGVGARAVVGARYATNSVLVEGDPNEWEVFAGWSPLRQARHAVDGAGRIGWNGTAGSVDGEVALGRDVGPVGVRVAGRAFSAWAGGDAAAAVALGAVWRVHRWAALAVDGVQLSESDADAGWSVGLQLAIPYSPHTLSLHVSNVNATTLQSGSVGTDRRLWGFEFTVPVTLARYLGRDEGGRAADRTAGAADPGPATAADDPAPSNSAPPRIAAQVEMNNRLRFLPDTVRVRVGESVRWRNTSDIIHTVTADPDAAADPANVALPDGAEPFDSGALVPGAEYVRRFDVPGTYRYVCLPHEAAGMTGVVRVDPD